MKKFFYKIAYYFFVVYYSIIWNEWSPWAIARVNLAWQKYTETPMYAERKKIDFMRVSPDCEDYAEQAFLDNKEAFYFIKKLSWKDKLKILLMPFSCGDHYKLPFYKIWLWWYGIKEN